MYDDDFDEFSDDFDDDSNWDSDCTITCAECRKSFYDDSSICPYCGWHVVEDSSFWANKPHWMRRIGMLAVILVLIAFLLPMVSLFLKLLSGR